MNKKVSIIIPCFNQGKYVKDAIESALNQTYKNIEIICINDGSSDNSSEVISNFKNIVFIDLKENQGVINARNLAIDSSNGEYILPLDADDKIEPTYVEKAVEILNNNPEIGIVYCKARFFGNANKEWILPEYSKERILFKNCIFNCALFRKEDFYRAGKYKENMKNGCEDWDLWLSMIELGLKPYRIDEILFNYRQLGNSSRTALASKNNHWKNQLFKNHINLYSNNPTIGEKIFFDISKSTRKIEKYKILFKFTLTLLIVSILFFTILTILIWK